MKKYTKKELARHLIDFSKQSGKTNVSKKDIDNAPLTPSSATYKRYFGSWNKAIQFVDLKMGLITGRPQNKELTINDKAIEVINGELLGDGCISFPNTSNTCFSHSTANIEYGKYLYNKLNILEVKLLNQEFLPSRNGGKPQFRTRSTTNIMWTKLHHKWYTNRRKIIPSDLILTKEVCLHWYLGDGYFENGTCKISTCGFSYEENKRLAHMLTVLGFKTTINKRSGGYHVIRLSKYSFQCFLDWIGRCPFSGYEHRWGL